MARSRSRTEGNAWRTAAKALIAVAGGTALAELTIGHVHGAQGCYAKASATTRRGTDYALRRYLQAFAQKGAADLTSQVHITPTAATRQAVATPKELAILKRCPDAALRFVILACSEAGLRSGTALKVTPQHIQEGHIVIRTKMAQQTKTPVSPALAAVMALAPEGQAGKPYVLSLAQRNWQPENAYNEIGKRWRAWKVTCGVRPELRFHDLRRGLARSLYLSSGGDLRAVQSLLSHKQLGSTLHYLEASDRRVTLTALQGAIERTQK